MSDDTSQFEEKIVPAWLVQRSVERALDEHGNVRGVEGRGGDHYAVLLEREQDE